MKMRLFSGRQLSQILISTSSALALFAALGAHAETPNSSSPPGRGIVGTGTLGIVGTGSPASTQGIVGTGSPASTQGIVGTGTLGIVGTGSPASTQGIVGTGSPASTQGIVGTGTLGIVGTGSPASTQGIVGTGTLGIVGTGSPASTQGIVGTGTLGIVGTGSPASTQGIVGTGTLGIVGTGTLGIVGTGTLGIVGTGVLDNVASRVSSSDPVEAFADWSSAVSSGRQSRLAVYGPVDAVSDTSVTILGQEFPIDDARLLQQLTVRDTVAVFVKGRGKKSEAYRVVKVLEEFVQGASLVYVTGIVSTKQRSDGSFKVGNLEVNIGEAGADSKAYQLKKGKRITIIGRKFDSEVSADRIVY